MKDLPGWVEQKGPFWWGIKRYCPMVASEGYAGNAIYFAFISPYLHIRDLKSIAAQGLY